MKFELETEDMLRIVCTLAVKLWEILNDYSLQSAYMYIQSLGSCFIEFINMNDLTQ